MDTSELEGILTSYLFWNKARIKCFVKMLLALINVRTTNMAELACAFRSKAKGLSRYRRMQRFIKEIKIDHKFIAMFVVKLFGLERKRLYLTMDRTNWKFGKVKINILVLGIVYKGIALPLYWKLLNKAGNSDTKERIEIVTRFVEQFGKDNIAGILADREFIGDEWFGFLIKEKLPFYIRIKNNIITTNARGLEVDIDGLFYGVGIHEISVLRGKRKVFDRELYLAGTKDKNGELLIIATNCDAQDGVEIYAKRWEIETLFGCLKTKGFNFEDTHLRNLNRIGTLMVLLTIGFCWCYKIGEWRHEVRPIKLKKHGRRAISLFRYGLDFIRELLLGFKQMCKSFKVCIQILYPAGTTYLLLSKAN